MLRAALVVSLAFLSPSAAWHETTAPCAADAPEGALCLHAARAPATYDLRFGVRLAAHEVAGGEVHGDDLLLQLLEVASGPGQATGLYPIDRPATLATVAFFVWEVDTAAHLLLP